MSVSAEVLALNPEPEESRSLMLQLLQPEAMRLMARQSADDALSRYLTGLLAAIDGVAYTGWDEELQQALDAWVAAFFEVMADHRFHIRKDLRFELVGMTPVLARLAHMSRFGSTDSALQQVSVKQDNVAKQLLLYSPYNRGEILRDKIFAEHPLLASKWLSAVCRMDKVSEKSFHWLRRVMAHPPLRMIPSEVHQDYFHISYIDPNKERDVRSRIVDCIRRQVKMDGYENTSPDFRKIAVVSHHWYDSHAVYRSLSPYIESLRDHYHLTLVNLNHDREKVDRAMFDVVLDLPVTTEASYDVQDVLKVMNGHEFGVIIYPSIGIVPETIGLASMRLAPIQITCVGQPVSSWCDTIDYFITGAKCEDMEAARQRYAERLVLLPDFGAFPVPKGDAPDCHRPDVSEGLRISCAWGSLKTAYPMLQQLQLIARQAEKPVTFVFSAIKAKGLRYQTFVKDVKAVMGEANCEFYPVLPYEEYARVLGSCHLAIDAHPYGSFNQVVDHLHVGVPMLSYEEKWLSTRYTPALMRHIGLDAMVASSADDLLDKAVGWINAPESLTSLCDAVDWPQALSRLRETDSARYFCKAIDYLCEEHETLMRRLDKNPIRITKD